MGERDWAGVVTDSRVSFGPPVPPFRVVLLLFPSSCLGLSKFPARSADGTTACDLPRSWSASHRPVLGLLFFQLE